MAKLRADLVSDTSSFESGMKRAGQAASKFGGTVGKAVGMATTAIAATTAALGALTVKQMGVIDATSKLSASLGIQLENFQALSLVANEAGVDQEKLGMFITRSQKALIEASRGTETYGRSFRALGLDIGELIKLSPDQQFLKIAEALEKVENPTQRTAMALEIFGRGGATAINMLDGLSEKLEEARAFNDKFNITLSNIDAAKVEEANDTFGRLGMAVSGLGNTLAVYFSPIVTEISNQLLNAGIDGETFGRVLEGAMGIVTSAIDMVRVSILGIRGLMARISLGINLMVLDATTGLFNIAKAAEKIPLIGEKMASVQQGLAQINQLTQVSAKQSQKAIEELEEEAGKYKTTLSAIEEIQKKADERAKVSASKNKQDLSEFVEGMEEATEKTSALKDKQIEANDTLRDFQSTSGFAIDSFISDLQSGENALDSFKSLALSVLSDVVKNVFQMNSSGSGGLGNLISGGISSLFSGMFDSSGISTNALSLASSGSLFTLPGFATGIDTVPHDMAAIIHKDEAVLNKTDAEAWRSGGGSTYNIDARGADNGAIRRIEQALRLLAGPGVTESRISEARARGAQ